MPYQAYENSDVIRAITVDGDQVFFRNAEDVFRIPLAGGAPVKISSPSSLKLQFDLFPSIWIVGDKLVGQAPGYPIFLESPKTGGPWTPLFNLNGEKIDTRATDQRVLHDIFARRASDAHPAIFDGTSFYWVEVTSESKSKKQSSSIRSVPLSGGAARTLYDWDGELRALAKAGDRLVFMRTDPRPEPEKQRPAGHAKGKAPPPPSAAATPPTFLVSMPVAGGKAEPLTRFGGGMGGNIGPRGAVVVTDGDTVYLSGLEDEDLRKAGLFRISASGASRLERIDERQISGQGLVYGDRIVVVGPGPIEPPSKVQPTSGNDLFANLGTVVLTGERHGKSLERAACIRGNHTTMAYAVAGKTLLMSIFNDDIHKAAIVRVPLP